MIAVQLPAFLAFLQVVAIDLILAGDNAVAVGLAAAGLPVHQRRRAIVIGLVAAVLTRIAFALVAIQLLAIPGLLLVGGVLLAWVCWKMWSDMRTANDAVADAMGHPGSSKTFGSAVIQILIADVSMSLDNVLAVAGAAREHPTLMAVGLLLSIALMGVAANWIARLLEKFRWIGYVGLIIVVIVAGRMIYEGAIEVMPMVVGSTIT